MRVVSKIRMRWVVQEILDRRQLDGRDEVLVQWACTWISREDYASGHLGAVAQTIMSRTVGQDDQVLVQWAVSWEAAAFVDAGLLEEFGGAEAGADGEVGDAGRPEVGSAATAGRAAEPVRAVKRRRRASRGW
jgi:hypothetical protein